MGAVDPTYPLYPIACIIAAVMLFIVMLTSFIRQNWNLGVAFLCFWLFFENIACAINTVVWSGNAETKFYAYCDIVSRLEIVCYVVKPMSTLIITRRLYLISTLQSVEMPSMAARRWNTFVEWTLGCIIPLLVAGPFYYVVQDSRFRVVEGFGCINHTKTSGLTMLLMKGWGTIPPLVSIVFYYPKVAQLFYRQSKDVNSFLHSNNSVSSTNYLRILMLASIDVALTLPMGTVNITLYVLAALVDPSHTVPFYSSWDNVHTNWSPMSVTYTELEAQGKSSIALEYFVHWVTPVLAFVIFGLFGCTAEARTSYWRMFRAVAGCFGLKSALYSQRRSNSATLDSINFGERPQDLSQVDLSNGSRPSFIQPICPVVDLDAKENSYAHGKVSTFLPSPDTNSDCSDVESSRAPSTVHTVDMA